MTRCSDRFGMFWHVLVAFCLAGPLYKGLATLGEAALTGHQGVRGNRHGDFRFSQRCAVGIAWDGEPDAGVSQRLVRNFFRICPEVVLKFTSYWDILGKLRPLQLTRLR